MPDLSQNFQRVIKLINSWRSRLGRALINGVGRFPVTIVAIATLIIAILTTGFTAVIINIQNQDGSTTLAPQFVNQNETILSFVNDQNEKHSLKLELAKTPEERTQGLMNRTSLLPSTGMFFIFPQPEPNLEFWMLNTHISLDIIFLDQNFQVVNIHKYTKIDQTEERYPAAGPAQFVIEASAGWADFVGVEIGDQFFVE